MLTQFTMLSLLVACATPTPPPAEPDSTQAKHSRAAEAAPEAPVYLGIVTARKAEMIPVAFTGRLKKLDVHPGQTVHAGDRIALLDDTDLKTKIESMKHQERSSMAQAGAYGAMASKAAVDLKTNRQLVAMGAMPAQALRTIQADMAMQGGQGGAAAEQGNAVKFDRQTLERQLEHAEIKAQNDGVIMMVRAKEGEVAQQGQPIARLFDKSDLIVRFSVPKSQRAKVKKTGRVELQIEGTKRTLWATIESYNDEEAPLNTMVVTADLDDSKLGPDEVALASVAHVKLIDSKKKL